MSGHSKWSTIKRQKQTNDIRRGKIFSKFSKAISLAVKSGGGNDPVTNYKLRMVIENAKSQNMPKNNIDRALARAAKGAELISEVVYEGFGPGGIAVMVETATDNRNRTAQEIKNLFERGEGSLGGPGSVSFNFDPKGLIVVKKDKDVESQILALIELGIEDVDEAEDGVELYTKPDELKKIRDKVESSNFTIQSAELTQKPKVTKMVDDEADAKKVLRFLDSLENNDDVQQVHVNVDIPEDIIETANST